MGRKAGLTDQKLAAVLSDDLSGFTDVERLVIELADAMAATPSNVSDGSWQSDFGRNYS